MDIPETILGILLYNYVFGDYHLDLFQIGR